MFGKYGLRTDICTLAQSRQVQLEGNNFSVNTTKYKNLIYKLSSH